jgi:hypothetical protein
MKQVVLLLSIFLFANKINKAQTIVASDMPNVGSFYYQFKDVSPTPSNFVQNLTGNGLQWDYTTAYNLSDTDLWVFTPSSSLPFNLLNAFPTTEFALVDIVDSAAICLVSDDSGFYITGVYSEGIVDSLNLDSIFFQGGFMINPTPISFSLNDSIMHESRFFQYRDTVYSTPLGPITTQLKLQRTFVQRFFPNGAGLLKLPTGSFNNVLRVKEIQYSLDTVFVLNPLTQQFQPAYTQGPNDSIVIYRWMQGGQNITLLAELRLDGVSLTPFEASYYALDLTTEINNTTKDLSFGVFPNPSQNLKTISFVNKNNAVESLEITDLMGRVVVQQHNLGAVNSINIEQLNPGQYFIKGKTKNNTTLVQKFIVGQ